MSCWLIEHKPTSLESPSDSNDEDISDYENSENSDEVSGSQTDSSGRDFDDDDFDSNSLEIDEDERHKISAQINPDEGEDDDDANTEEEKEEIIEKEDSGHEKNKDEREGVLVSESLRGVCSVTLDDDPCQRPPTAAGLDDGETSMTESAEIRTMDTHGLIQKLDSERRQLLLELERDEQQRQYFYNKLKTVTQKMENLQQSDHTLAQTSSARHELETEAYNIQRTMQETLGLGGEGILKQKGRINRIQNIETEILSLQGRATQTFVGKKDASTSTVLGKDAFKMLPDQEDGWRGCVSVRVEASNSHSATVSTQTRDVTLVKIPEGVAPGIPLSSSPLMIHSGKSSSPFSSLQTTTDVNLSRICGSMGVNPGHLQHAMMPQVNENEGQTHQLEPKVEMVYSLLSMLGTHDKDDMARTLFAMSQSQDSCTAMRQSGCLPLLLQLLHGNYKDPGILGTTRGSKAARALASAALHNIVHCNHDDKRGRREARTLRLLEQIRAHCDQQRGEGDGSVIDHHPGAAIAALMKLSFDEDYRHAICSLGGLQAIAELLEVDNNTATPMNDYSTTVRRYSCMALTNLTFGDGKNKALLCSMRGAMQALTDQLRSTNEDLIQAAASVLRNLSWRADLASKKTLREIAVVTTLMRSALIVKKETTLKSILSALWNLSSHCSENKAEICAVEGALQFLVGLLTYKSTTKTLAIIENGGGILRNVSSHIAIREDYRQILRKHDCLKILLFHLKSPSLTIVSNACGTLWNLSARCEEDQNALRDMGAVSMLRNLVHSRHKMISSGSSAALKNLLTSVPAGKSVASDRSAGSPRPCLHVRRQRAIEAELDHNLSETCENVDSPRNSPTEFVHRSESEPRRFVYHLNGVGGNNVGGLGHEEDTRKHMTRRQMMPRNCIEGVTSSSEHGSHAGSQDSVGSTHSDISHDRTRTRAMLAKSSHLLYKRQSSSLDRKEEHALALCSMPQTSQSPNITLDYKASVGQNSDSVILKHDKAVPLLCHSVNGIPNHKFQLQFTDPHYQRQAHSQQWQTMPKNHVMQNIPHNVAVDTGSESISNTFPTYPSLLTQSAPPQTFNHQDTNYGHRQTLLERLAKSSSGLSRSCNLNNSLTVANTSPYSTLDYSHHLAQSVTAQSTEQPVNYSLKLQDRIFGHGNSKPSKSTMLLSFDNEVLISAANSKSETLNECIKPSVLNSSLNEHNFLLNNSFLYEKIQSNNRHAGKILGSNTLLNSTLLTTHRPVPNLVHNNFHAPQSYLLDDIPQYHPQLTTVPVAYAYNTSVLPQKFDYPLSHSFHSKDLAPYTAGIDKRNSSFAKSFSTSADQFHMLQAAHQNVQNTNTHNNPIHRYTPTNFCPREDQPMHFNAQYIEIPNDDFCKGKQEQPVNYSVRFCGNGKRDGQEKETGQGGRNVGEKSEVQTMQTCDNISYGNRHSGTFCAEDGSYLSTPTSSLTNVDQSGGSERREQFGMEDEDDGDDHNTVTTTADDEVDTDLEGTELSEMSGSSDQHSVGALDQIESCSQEEASPHFPGLPSSRADLKEIGGQARQSNHTEKLALVEEVDTMIISSDEDQEHNIDSSTHVRHTDALQSIKGDKGLRTFDNSDQLQEMPLRFSRSSSSPESESSSEYRPIQSTVIREYSRRTSEMVSLSEVPDSPTEQSPPSPKHTFFAGKNCEDFSPIPKSKNVIAKQSLKFDKTPTTAKSDSFITFTTFDEEDKPVSFGAWKPQMPLKLSFPRFGDDQNSDFSSFGTELDEQPHLTFSTFQKNFHPPKTNQGNHSSTRLLTPKAKTMPTLIEQIAEMESAGKLDATVGSTENVSQSEFPLHHKESDMKSTPPQYTMGMTSTLDAGKSELESAQKLNTHRASGQVKQTSAKNWSPKREKHKEDVGNFSVFEVSEQEEDSLHCVSSGMSHQLTETMITQSSSPRTARTKKRSGIPMKRGIATNSKALERASLLQEPVSAKLIYSRPKFDDLENEDISLSEEDERNQILQEKKSDTSERKMLRVSKSDDSDSDNMSTHESVHSSIGQKLSSNSQTHLNLNAAAPGFDFIPINSTKIIRLETMSPTKTARTSRIENMSPTNTTRISRHENVSIDQPVYNVKTDSPELKICLSRIPKAGKGHSGQRTVMKPEQAVSSDKLHPPVSALISEPSTGLLNTRLPMLTYSAGMNNATDSPKNTEDNSFVNTANKSLPNQSKGKIPISFSLKEPVYSHGERDMDSEDATMARTLRSSSISEEEQTDRQYMIGSAPDDGGQTPLLSASLVTLNNIYEIEKLYNFSSDFKLKETLQLSGTSEECSFTDSPSEVHGSHNINSVHVLEYSRKSSIPKLRLPKDQESVKNLSRTKLLGKCEDVNGSEITKSASMKLATDYLSSNEIDIESQSSSSHDDDSFGNIMTHSCSDLVELDLNFQKYCYQGGVSAEDTERLLAENVNLIMSEIQTTKLSGSSVDEDLFIEHETISLVSHGYTSDTNSEVSVTWSVASDKTTDLSSTTVTGNQSQASSSTRCGGPKFLKPESARIPVKKAVADDSGPKIVRGRRKPLYSSRPNNATLVARGNVKAVVPLRCRGTNVPTNNKGGTQNVTARSETVNAAIGTKKTPAKNQNVVQTSPKTVPLQCSNTKSSSPPLNAISRRSRSAGPATTPRRSAPPLTVLAGVNKNTQKATQTVAQNNRTNLARSASKTPGTGQKSNLPVNLSTAVSTGQSKIPTISSLSSYQTRIPNINTNNKGNNNSTVIANNKTNKSGVNTPRSASSTALNNSTVEKRAGQNTGKVSYCNSATQNKRGSDSGIPTRKSSSSLSSVSNADSNKRTLPGNVNKRISPVNTDTGKQNLSGNAENSKQILADNADSEKRDSTVILDSVKSKSPSCTDLNKHASLGNTESSKRTSTGNAESTTKRTPPGDSSKRNSPSNSDPSKRTSPGNTDANKRNSTSSMDMNKRATPGSTDPSKNTSSGMQSKKPGISRLTTLWKRSESQDKSPSTGSPASSTAMTKLPISAKTPNNKPLTGTPAVFKAKAATLPNSNLASSKSRSTIGQISRSSTYEKISSEVQGHNSKSFSRIVGTAKKMPQPAKSVKEKSGSSDSSESGVTGRKIFDLYYDDDDDDSDNDSSTDSSLSTDIKNSKADDHTESSSDPGEKVNNAFRDSPSGCHSDIRITLTSASDSVASLDLFGDAEIHIDSSTFRKKKRDPGVSDFDLPNADETCRSMCSSSDSLQTPYLRTMSRSSNKNSGSVYSIKREMDIIDILQSELSDSANDFKTKNMEERTSSKSKSIVPTGLKKLFSGRHKDKDKEMKVKNSNKDTSKSKHFHKDKKYGKDKREYDFFRSNIKIEPSTTWRTDDLFDYDLEGNSFPCIGHIPLITGSFTSNTTVATANSTFISKSAALPYNSTVALNNSTTASNKSTTASNNSTAASNNSTVTSNNSTAAKNSSINQGVDHSRNDDKQGEVSEGGSSATESHMTKTEMLIARRQKTNLSSSQSGQGCRDVTYPPVCAVTSV